MNDENRNIYDESENNNERTNTYEENAGEATIPAVNNVRENEAINEAVAEPEDTAFEKTTVNGDAAFGAAHSEAPVNRASYEATQGSRIINSMGNPVHRAAEHTGAGYTPYSENGAGAGGANAYERPIGEKSGIRYDIDRTSDDGRYTWKYEDTAPEKPKKKKTGIIIGAVAGGLALVCLAAAAGFFLLPKLIGTDNLDKAGEKDAEKAQAIEESYSEDKGNVSATKDKAEAAGKPFIEKNSGSKGKPSQGEAVLDEMENDGTLSKQLIAVKCQPSSVGIEVTVTTGTFYGYSYQSRGVGSGFILTEDGYIATNNHVIEDANEITVMLNDGTKYPATVIGADAVTDLAVIKIEAEGLIPMEIGDSDLMQVGDSVIAIGTPASIEFAGTVTDGIISAINRDIEVESTNGRTKTMTLMQTNAAINPGNSGGPLINDKGQVIGINTLKLNEKYEGIGFSIPINSAVNIINQLIQDGKVTDYDTSFVSGNGAIGITNYFEVNAEESKYYGIPEGIMVIQLQVGAASQKAGLRRGDIITAFNGQTVKTVNELNALKNKFKAGDEVTLTVYRSDDETLDITFKLDIMN